MKTNKLLYGALAFAPLFFILVMFIFMGLMFSEVFSDIGSHHYRNEVDMPYYMEMMVVAMIASVFGITALITYVLHCMRNIHISHEKRTMWIVILVLGGTIGTVIYFFTWIMKEDRLNAENPVGF